MFVLFAWAWYAWASRRETGALATVGAHRGRGGGYTAPRPADIQPRTRRSHHCLETTARDPPAVLLPRPVRLHPGGDHACCVRRPANRRNRTQAPAPPPSTDDTAASRQLQARLATDEDLD